MIRSPWPYIFFALAVLGMFFSSSFYPKNPAELQVLEQENQKLHQEIITLRKKSFSSKETLPPAPSMEIFSQVLEENKALKKEIRSLRQDSSNVEISLSPSHTVFRVATGAPQGYYYQLGKHLQKQNEDSLLYFKLLESPGATQNIIFLNIQKADFAFTQLDSVLSFRESPATKNLIREIAFVAPIVEEKIHLLVREDSQIPTPNNEVDLKNLRGKRVHLGPVGSGTRVSSTRLLEIAGVPVGSLKVDGAFLGNAFERLQKGKIDAMFCIIATPGPLFRDLSPGKMSEIKLCSFSPRLLKRIEKNKTLGYQVCQIPEGTYPWQKESIRTVGTDCLLVARRRLDRNTIIELLRNLSQKNGLVDLDNLKKSFTHHYNHYHPGVKKFLEEKE